MTEQKTPPRLDCCPNEIIESVVVLLAFPDICNLRLVSRLISVKVVQEHFKSFYKKKHVDLTEESLQALQYNTVNKGRLGCLVEELTLVGIVNNTLGLEAILRKKTNSVTEHNGPMFMTTEVRCTDEELTQAQNDLNILKQRTVDQKYLIESALAVDLLATAFTNLANNAKHLPIPNIKLGISIFRQDATTRLPPLQGGSWKLIWNCAAQTLQITTAALARSKLPINELDVYSELPRCAVARDQIIHLLPTSDSPGLAESLKHLKAFSISMSHRIISETEQDRKRLYDPGEHVSYSDVPIYRDIDILRGEARAEENFGGLVELLKLCENVERLDIHQYSLARKKLTQRDMCDTLVLQRLVEGVTLANLKGVRLRGLHVREEDLVKFLRQSRVLGQVVLQEMEIDDEGSWGNVFAALTAGQVDFLFVDDLFEGGKLLYFDGEGDGQPKYPTLDNCRGTNGFVRKGVEDVQREVRYHFAEARPYGSPQAWRWREGRRLAYGPP